MPLHALLAILLKRRIWSAPVHFVTKNTIAEQLSKWEFIATVDIIRYKRHRQSWSSRRQCNMDEITNRKRRIMKISMAACPRIDDKTHPNFLANAGTCFASYAQVFHALLAMHANVRDWPNRLQNWEETPLLRNSACGNAWFKPKTHQPMPLHALLAVLLKRRIWSAPVHFVTKHYCRAAQQMGVHCEGWYSKVQTTPTELI